MFSFYQKSLLFILYSIFPVSILILLSLDCFAKLFILFYFYYIIYVIFYLYIIYLYIYIIRLFFPIVFNFI